MEDTLLIGSSFGLIPNPVDIIIYILYIIIGQEQDEYEFSCTIIIKEERIPRQKYLSLIPFCWKSIYGIQKIKKIWRIHIL